MLVFIGGKVLISAALDYDFPHALSLAVTLGLLLGGALFSLHRTKGEPESKPAE